LLTPIGSSGSWQLPLTNRDPTLEIKSFTPLVFAQILIIYFPVSTEILIFLQSRKKCVSFNFSAGRRNRGGAGPPPPSFAKCPFSGSKVPFSCVKNVIKIAFFAQMALLKT
jgi:hypothetical protein